MRGSRGVAAAVRSEGRRRSRRFHAMSLPVTPQVAFTDVIAVFV
jgi:hypothetical protein